MGAHASYGGRKRLFCQMVFWLLQAVIFTRRLPQSEQIAPEMTLFVIYFESFFGFGQECFIG
jgi:hypothetical protein